VAVRRARKKFFAPPWLALGVRPGSVPAEGGFAQSRRTEFIPFREKIRTECIPFYTAGTMARRLL
jgi:hypothetical protein